MLLGLSESTSGTATISGINCTRDPIRVERIVGYLPDNTGFYPDLTGRENLRLIGRMNGVAADVIDKRMDALLERVGMTQSADRKAGTYSKGMKQRLGIYARYFEKAGEKDASGDTTKSAFKARKH